MFPSTTGETAQAAASLALDQLRVVLAFVRDNATWIGDRLNDLIHAMKVKALDLLIAILDDGSDTVVPASIMESATSEPALVVEATVPEDDHAIVESVASFASDAGDFHVDTTTATATPVARRCVLVVSTWTKAALGAAGTAACYQSLDVLRDLRIPVEVRELDSVVHRSAFLHYKKMAHNAPFPQFFIEDEDTGANCVFLRHDDLEVSVVCMWILLCVQYDGLKSVLFVCVFCADTGNEPLEWWREPPRAHRRRAGRVCGASGAPRHTRL
jgi:hypothetical protein